MSHFIQPISGITGSPECVMYGATTPKWRTISALGVYSNTTGVEDDDSWTVSITDPPDIKIGSSCALTATVRFTITNPTDPGSYSGEVLVNGVSEGSFSGSMPGDGVDIVEDIAVSTSGSPCGDIWEINFDVSPNTNGNTVEIISVTFV